MGRWIGGFVVLGAIGLGGCMGHAADDGARAERPVPVAQALSVRIALPERGEIPVRGDKPALHVVFENVSKKPLGIIDEWCSMGCFNLEFEYTMSDGVRRRMEKGGYYIWLRNYLTFTTLRPGEVLVRDIYFDPSKWIGLPTITQDTPMQIEAIFSETGSDPHLDAPTTEPAVWKGETPYWKGRVRSAPVQMMLRVARP